MYAISVMTLHTPPPISYNTDIYRLIIDTSSEHNLIGVTKGLTILASEISLHANRLSQTLLPHIQTLLNKTDLPLSKIQEIAIGIGPGSYTGTRLGVAVAKSLHFALPHISLQPFCSLLSFLPPINGLFACVMPSKSGNFYILKGSSFQSTITLTHSQLFDRSEAILLLEDVDLLIGKPLAEIQKLLPFSKTLWTLPSPTLSSILHYLQSPSCHKKSPFHLIYLQ